MGDFLWSLYFILSNKDLFTELYSLHPYREQEFWLPVHMGVPSFMIYSSVILLVNLISDHLVMAASSSTSTKMEMSTAILIRVDQSGLGDFKNIQDAIDAVPSNNSELVFIWVKPGIYRSVISPFCDMPKFDPS